MEHRDSVFTAHKPLLTLFNKEKARMPPKIEKWVTEMQDVDLSWCMYEPVKDEADPLDYLSRHPLPETVDDSIEKIIRWTVNTEHAEVITRIREKTPKDEVMQQLEEKREGELGEAQARQILGTTPLREAKVVNRRRTNFERAAYSATSNRTEERCQARTKP